MTAGIEDETAWAVLLRKAAESGEFLDLAPDMPQQELRFRPDGEADALRRQVPAEDIRAVLLDKALIADPLGLQLGGAIITGVLDLDHMVAPCRLAFSHCRFENAPSFEHLTISELVLKWVVLPGLSLVSARVSGNADFTGIRSTGEVNAQSVHIGGHFFLSDAIVSNDAGSAVRLEYSEIDGSIVMERFEASGEVSAILTRVGKQVLLESAKLSNTGGTALNLASTQVSDVLDMRNMEASGGVNAAITRIGGELLGAGSTLSNQGGTALNLAGAEIRGNVLLDGMQTEGEVLADNAHLRAHLTMVRAVLSNAGKTALSLNVTEILGMADLSFLSAEGEVQAMGVQIGSQFVMVGANINNLGGLALVLDGAEVPQVAALDRLVASGEIRAHDGRFGMLTLTGAKVDNPAGTAIGFDRSGISGALFLNGVESRGQSRLSGVHIGGDLVLTGAKLDNLYGSSLVLVSSVIKGNAYLGGLEAKGEIRADGLHVEGQLDMQRANLSNPHGDALNLSRAEVGDTFMGWMEVEGLVRATGTHFSGRLDLSGARLSKSGRPVQHRLMDFDALYLGGANVDLLLFDTATKVEGLTDLSYATIGILVVGETQPVDGLPRLSSAQGWTLGTFHGFLRTDRKEAREWLDTITISPLGGRQEFASQPWKELAKIYDQIGQPEDARRLRFWAARRTTRFAPWPSKLVRWPYAALVGYGYYPLIVFGWLAALWLTVFIVCIMNAEAFTPTEYSVPLPINYPPFNPAMFALDTAVPAAATGQSAAWRMTGNAYLLGALAAIKAFGWLLTALLLAGITGILRKD